MDTATEKRDRARHYRDIADQVTDASAREGIRELADRLEAEARESAKTASGADGKPGSEKSGQRTAH
jgi:hypothetical protein